MQFKRRLSALDLGFLAAETRESMMHVGALMQFAPSADTKEDFLFELMEEIKREARVEPPWNLKLRFPDVPANPFQSWIEDEAFDAEYHVRRAALPTPGGERELGVLVSRLHSHAIDLHRPPWEVTFIEGLGDGRFAMYVKVHHSLIDGYTGMRLLARTLSTDPEARDPVFFAVPPHAREKRASVPAAAPTLDVLVERLKDELGATRAAGRALAKFIRTGKERGTLVAPLEAPRTTFNTRVSRNRRFATQQFKVDRLRRVAQAFGGTVNDAVLALCAAALRRLMLEHGTLPDEAMTAMIPVNVRPKDDPGGGNAVGAVLATLATHLVDPRARLEAIVASTKSAKAQLQGLSQNAILQYTTMLVSPMLLSQPPGAAGRVRPAFNVVISNVPGPSEPLYFRGNRLEAYYPLSIPFHGYGLNITVVSYVDTLNFGFTGDRDSLPHLQRLAVYARDALVELEEAH